jgi:conjugative relaxase-like TrwC/TraI family protein
MLSVSRIGSPGAAAAYYTREDHASIGLADENAVESISVVDADGVLVEYYMLSEDDGQTKLHWAGDGAEHLGLQGEVAEDDLRAVLHGINPDADGEAISKREQTLRRAADEKAEKAPSAPKDGPAENGEEDREATGSEKDEKTGWSAMSLDERVAAAAQSGDKHVAGWDLTFSAPKSISIVALDAEGDERLQDAHRQAVDVAMAYIEKHFSVYRIREGDGERREEIAGNFLMARTTHMTSRAGDPNLHDHVLVMNAVRDEDGTWRALESEHIFKHMKLAGGIYQAELRNLVRELGHDVRDGDTLNTFELAEVPANAVLAHSQRHRQIDANRAEMEAAKGRPLSKAEDEAAVLKDRPAKSEQTLDALRSDWSATNEREGLSVKDLARAAADRGTGRDRSFASASPFLDAIEKVKDFFRGSTAVYEKPLDALNYGKEAAFHTTTVATQHDMLFRALTANGNRLRLDDYLDTGFFERKDFNRADKTVLAGVTTDEIVDRERGINRHIENRRGHARGFAPDLVAEALKPEALRARGIDVDLTPDQLGAVHTALTSQDGVIAIQGFAGAGKTTAFETMESTFGALQAMTGAKSSLGGPGLVTMLFGDQVKADAFAKARAQILKGAAPTHAAVRELTSKNIESDTLSAMLSRYTFAREQAPNYMRTLRQELKGSTLIVDEASMLGNRQLETLFQMQSDLKIDKVLLSGDVRQIAALQAGAPFKMGMEHNPNMARAELTTILRQNDNPTLKEAVIAFAEGKSADAMRRLEPFIHETGRGAGDEALAAKAHALWRASEGQAKVVVDTNSMRGRLNGLIRADLVAAGAVSSEGFLQPTYRDAGMSNHDKMVSRFYEKGEVLFFFGDAGRFKAGETLDIDGLNHKRNLINGTLRDGSRATLDITQQQKGRDLPFGVYWRSETEFATGDRVLFNRTDKDRGIRTNDEFVISGWDKDQVRLRGREGGDELSLPRKDPQLEFMTYAYAVTADKAQGKSFERVVAVLKSVGQGDFVNHARAYIMASRAKSDFDLVTDSFRDLMRKVTEHDGINLIGLDNLFGGRPKAGKSLDLPIGIDGDRPGNRYSTDGSRDIGDKVKTMDRPQPERGM